MALMVKERSNYDVNNFHIDDDLVVADYGKNK